MVKGKVIKKFIFTLKDINVKNIEKKFGIIFEEDQKDSHIEPNPTNITKLCDLTVHNENVGTVSFLDESRKIHKCIVSMIDFNTNLETKYLRYNCFWCRHPIPEDNQGIGCPVKYITTKAIKSYYSEISKDNYTIKENITINKLKKIEDDVRLTFDNKDCYLTDGIFCSFNCCMSYINDNKQNSLYDMSEMLLLKMYNTIYPKSITNIEYAPSWKMLTEYGGNLDIIQFRNSFNKIEYKYFGTTKLSQQSLVNLFEEKLKF